MKIGARVYSDRDFRCPFCPIKLNGNDHILIAATHLQDDHKLKVIHVGTETEVLSDEDSDKLIFRTVATFGAERLPRSPKKTKPRATAKGSPLLGSR
jgi:hypothetical protein